MISDVTFPVRNYASSVLHIWHESHTQIKVFFKNEVIPYKRCGSEETVFCTKRIRFIVAQFIGLCRERKPEFSSFNTGWGRYWSWIECFHQNKWNLFWRQLSIFPFAIFWVCAKHCNISLKLSTFIFILFCFLQAVNYREIISHVASIFMKVVVSWQFHSRLSARTYKPAQL